MSTSRVGAGIYRRWLSLAISSFALTACGPAEPVTPEPDPQPAGVRIVSGAGTTDTIEAELRQALVVEVTGTNGRPVQGTLVRFSALPPEDTARRFLRGIYVSAQGSTTPQSQFEDTTNASGRLSASVRFGRVAGPARIAISVPSLSFNDTARYSVEPGAGVRVRFVMPDTFMGVGRTLPLRASHLDRASNTRPESPTYESFNSACSVLSGAALRGDRPALCAIRAAVGSVSDTLDVAITPSMELIGVVSELTRRVVRLDLATGVQTDVAGFSGFEGYPIAQAGVGVVYRDADRLVILRPNGSRVDPLVTGTGLLWTGWQRLTRDGQWVYFASDRGLWRVRPDGTLPQQIGPFGSVPDPSPDGSRLAWWSDGNIYIMDLSAPSITSPLTTGFMPRWSPNGQRIAFVRNAELWVMNADGSDQKSLLPNVADNLGVDWSADGAWLVTMAPRLLLVRPDGSEKIPVWLPTFGQPSVVR